MGKDFKLKKGIRIRMIYSFRPLPLMKGCGWMTCHLTVHTVSIPMSKKTIKLTTMYLAIGTKKEEERKKKESKFATRSQNIPNREFGNLSSVFHPKVTIVIMSVTPRGRCR